MNVYTFKDKIVMTDRTFKQYLKEIQEGPAVGLDDSDTIADAQELVQIAQNDPALYKRQYMPIIINLMRDFL